MSQWRKIESPAMLLPRLHLGPVREKMPAARDALRAVGEKIPCVIQDNNGSMLDWSPDGRFAAIISSTPNAGDKRNKGDEKDYHTFYALIHDTKTGSNYVCVLDKSTRILNTTTGWSGDSRIYGVLNWVPFTQTAYFVSPPSDPAPDSAQPTAPDEPSKENKP